MSNKTFYINSNVKVSGLPEIIKINKGDYFIAIKGLKIENECEFVEHINTFQSNNRTGKKKDF